MALNLYDLVHVHASQLGPELRQCGESLCSELRRSFCDAVDCTSYKLDVRLFGSMHNDTCIAGSDADIAVIPTGCYGMAVHPNHGPNPEVVCDVLALREYLFNHLRRRFGDRFVCQQRKAILLCGTPQRIQADIVVLLPQVWQHGICPACRMPKCSHGYELRSTCDPNCPISTWPEQHHENSRLFDARTGGRYKRSVRALKGILRCGSGGSAELLDIANQTPPVLIENLLGGVPAECYLHSGSCTLDVLKHILGKLQRQFQMGEAQGFQELSGLRPLFDKSQTWDIQQAYNNVMRLSRFFAS